MCARLPSGCSRNRSGTPCFRRCALRSDDSDPYIRAVAALALANHGEVPALSFFEDIIQRNYGFGNFPYGADSSIGVEAGMPCGPTPGWPARRQQDIRVPGAAPATQSRRYQQAVSGAGRIAAPASGCRRYPPTVQDTERWGPLRVFVQAIFQQAGKEMLPTLHRALASPDRVRVFERRPCLRGHWRPIVHPVSDPGARHGKRPGPAPPSVWALGELKARESLPRLAELYADAARNADQIAASAAAFLPNRPWLPIKPNSPRSATWMPLPATGTNYKWRRCAVHTTRPAMKSCSPPSKPGGREQNRPGKSTGILPRTGRSEGCPGDRAQAALGLGAAAGPDREAAGRFSATCAAMPTRSCASARQ